MTQPEKHPASDIGERASTDMIVRMSLAGRAPQIRFPEGDAAEDDSCQLARRAGGYVATLRTTRDTDGLHELADVLRTACKDSIDLGVDGETIDGELVAMATRLHLATSETIDIIETPEGAPMEARMEISTIFQSWGVEPKEACL